MSTELITIDAAKAAGTLSVAVSQARELVSKASEGIGRDLVQVQAAAIIRQALTSDVKALILAAGECGQYEVVNYGDTVVKPDAQIAVCVLAVTLGLRLNGGQFSVWGDWRGGAKIYLKSAGYTQLLRNTGRATMIRKHVGYPEFVVLGKSKKGHDNGVAYMTGEASCLWDGVRVEVTAPEQFRIGIPWTATDNVDGIIAKGERRMLARLWAACGGEEESDDTAAGEAEPVTFEVMPDKADALAYQAITGPDAPAGRDWEAEKATYLEEYFGLPVCAAKDLYLCVMREESADGIAAIMATVATQQMDGRHRAAIERAADFRRQWLASRADMP